jgi:hypothetical protein
MGWACGQEWGDKEQIQHFWKSFRKCLLWRLRRITENNIKMDFKKLVMMTWGRSTSSRLCSVVGFVIITGKNLGSDTMVLVRFQVLTAESMKTTAFWDVARCSLIEVDWRFRGAYCLPHEGGRLHGSISQKALMTVVSVRLYKLDGTVSVPRL